MNKLSHILYEKAAQTAGCGGEQKSSKRPLETSCFLFNGEERRGTRPVHQRKQHHTQGRRLCPAVMYQKLTDRLHTSGFCNYPLRQICHDHHRHDNFIGWKPEDKRSQDHSVQSDHSRERVQQLRKSAKQGCFPY